MNTSKNTRLEFRHALQQEAMKLTTGEEEVIEVSKQLIAIEVEGGDTISENYIRNAINQYAPFSNTGNRIKVNGKGAKFKLTLMSTEEIERINRAPRRAGGQITHAAINSTSIAKVMAAVIEAEPDLSEMSGKQLESAVKVIALYRASLIEKLNEITNQNGEQ